MSSHTPDGPQAVISRIESLMISQGRERRQIKACLAAACGISKSAVHQWFNTTKNIRHQHLIAIAKTYGTTVDWLLTGEARHQESVSQVIREAKTEIIAVAELLQGHDVSTANRLLKVATKIGDLNDRI